jgi:hypothetical protein
LDGFYREFFVYGKGSCEMSFGFHFGLVACVISQTASGLPVVAALGTD